LLGSNSVGKDIIMSTSTTDNVKPKRTFGQKVKRFLKITVAIIGGTFLSLMALGIYLSQQEASEKAHAAALDSVDPTGRMTPEQREKALLEKRAAEAAVKKVAEEKAAQERKVQEEADKQRRAAQAEADKKAREQTRAAKEAEEARIKAEGTPMENAELIVHNWRSGGFGVVFIGNFSIKNKGVYPLKDFDIRCTVFGPSGTELGTVRQTAYETAKPKSTTRLQELNMGVMHSQGSRARCELRSVERAN